MSERLGGIIAGVQADENERLGRSLALPSVRTTINPLDLKVDK